MILYLALLAGAVALGIPMCRKKTGKIAYCIIMGLALFGVAALRRSVGHDYNNYGWMYLGYRSTTLEEIELNKVEKGYSIINKLLADYIEEYQIIFILCAAFFAVAVTLAVYKHCKLPWVGFACFLTFGTYFNSMNFLRQMIAGFIVMYAMRYIKKNQFFRYLLIVIFATCFHVSALVMIPFYFILRIKMTPITLGIYSGITVLVLIFSWNIIDLVTKFYYKSYITTNIHVTLGCEPDCAILFGIFFVLAFIFRKELVASDAFNNVWINCMFFLVFFEILGVKHSILSRLGVFFIMPVSIILAPRIVLVAVEKCKKLAKNDTKKRTLFSALAIGLFAALNLFMYGEYLLTNYNGVLPYRTMFENFNTGGTEQQ